MLGFFLRFQLRKTLQAFSGLMGHHGAVWGCVCVVSNQPRRPKRCSPHCRNHIFLSGTQLWPRILPVLEWQSLLFLGLEQLSPPT